MPTTTSYYRVRIRNAADDDDALVISSFPGDENPYIVEPPNGDGESFDPITGAPTTGAYSVRVADEVTGTGTRVVTAQLADVYARQQLLSRKTWVETSEDGSAWDTLVVGYIMALRLISAIEFEIAIGQSRRIEASRTVFREATSLFGGVTSVIGGPVRGGFSSLLEDHGGWQFVVAENNTSPDYIKLELDTNGGFDPRKYAGTFSSTSSAIADYTNNWVQPYFEPLAFGADIMGHFPGLRARLEPVVPGDAVTLIPLARPNPFAGNVWGDINFSLITDDGTSPLYLPTDGEDDAGDPVVFSPTVGDEYKVYIYALGVSDDNPLHWYGHPVDLWEDLRIEAGIDYDATVLAALKTLIGEDVRLLLRIRNSAKLGEVDQKIIYGPFRLSTRIEDGKRVLFSTDVTDIAPPATTITIDDLRSDDGTVFDLDEGSVVTAITIKTERVVRWTTVESEQPESDALASKRHYPESIENSDDDIPTGSENDQLIGDIPGQIETTTSGGPISMTAFLQNRGAEVFNRFGRGAIVCELRCLPNVTAKVGEEVLLDLPHMPGAIVGESPVSQRNIGPLPFQIIQRTETPEGPDLRLVNSLSADAADAVLPEFTLVANTIDDVRYGRVTITNAEDLGDAELNCRCDYSIAGSEPADGAGTHFTTILAAFMTDPTFAFDVGPVEEGATLWVQLRAESPGLRAGPYTAWQNVELTPP